MAEPLVPYPPKKLQKFVFAWLWLKYEPKCADDWIGTCPIQYGVRDFEKLSAQDFWDIWNNEIKGKYTINNKGKFVPITAETIERSA